jgi:hypothetical protein
MAQVVNVHAPDLTQAAATVAQHLETAAKPATAAAPLHAAASPADVAASGAAGAIHTKMAALSTELAPKGPAMQQAGATAAAALQAQDAANAARLPDVPKPPTPSVPTPQIQAVDRTWKKDPPPPPPGPLQRLGLPPYNWGSLSEEDARRVYAIGKLRIIERDEELQRQGASLEERARAASESRTALRQWIRDIQANRTLADWLDQNEPHLSWDDVLRKYQAQGLSGDDLWRKILEKSVDSREAVDAELGIDPKNPGALPPILPSKPEYPPLPTISAPPDLPSVGQHPPPGPLPPTVLNHPPTPVPPTVLDHPPLPPWLQDPSPPGFHLTPSQPPPIFNWDMPDPPPAPPPMPPPAGPPVNLHMPSIQPPTPQEAGAGGLLAIIAGVLGWLATAGRVTAGG